LINQKSLNNYAETRIINVTHFKTMELMQIIKITQAQKKIQLLLKNACVFLHSLNSQLLKLKTILKQNRKEQGSLPI